MRVVLYAKAVCILALSAVAALLLPTGASFGVCSIDGVVCRATTSEKVVALTFDDGPHPTFTPELLRVLDKYRVKATFFMIGSLMEKYPGVVKEVLKRGHLIANHSYSHPLNMELLTPTQMGDEIDKCEAVIERITGKRPRLFRPPRGLVDGTLLTVATERGYTTVLWSVCADHKNAPTPQLMAKRVLDGVKPGAIILAHDGTLGTRWKDVAATPLIIEGLVKQGYRFVTLPELIGYVKAIGKAPARTYRKTPKAVS